MSEELIVYRLYATIEDAVKAELCLQHEGIETEVVADSRRLPEAYLGTDYSDQIILRIPAADFPVANKILLESSKVDVKDIDPSHPLMSLNTDELLDVVAKADEWGPENFNIARALLASKGLNIPDEKLEELETQRINALSERKTLNPFVMALGYCSGMGAIAGIVYNYLIHSSLSNSIWFMPGIFGIFIGAIIMQSKSTLPDGTRFPTFNDSTIRNGIAMFVINILSWVICLLAIMFG